MAIKELSPQKGTEPQDRDLLHFYQLESETLPLYDFVTSDHLPFRVDINWLRGIAGRRQIHLTELLPSQKAKLVDIRPTAHESTDHLPDNLLSDILKKLRIEKNIPHTLEHGTGEVELPIDSRFGLNPTEIKEFVIPEAANLLGVESSKIRLPKISELIYLNWTHHLLERGDNMVMEWTNTEYFDDPQKQQYLGNVVLAQKGEHTDVSFWPGSKEARNPLIGFRLLITA